MTIEVANDYNDLDVNYPAQGDLLVEGDDHMRLLKKVHKQVWPGVGGNGFVGVISTTEAQLNFSNTLTSNVQDQLDAISAILMNGAGLVPIGAIIPYNGAFSAIPANFQLCDGTNGTPDMTDSFAFGTNIELEVNDAGGSNDAVVITHDHNADHNHIATSNQVPDHLHDVLSFNVDSVGGQGNKATSDGTGPVTEQTELAGAFTPTITIDPLTMQTGSTGTAGTGLNIPSFIKLAYIRRMS